MRRQIQLALLAALAAAFLAWTSLGHKPAAAPVAQKKKAKAEKKSAELPPPPVIAGEIVFDEPRPDDGRRNLFAYVAAPVAPVVKKHEPMAAAVPVAVAPVQPPAPVERVLEAPRFAYRYIGRFGPDGNPVAAFVRDGEIVTVKRGGTVGGFVVRDIGLESVDVAGDAGVVRVALGSSSR